ncbi:peptidoglycan D,D-transpeptidase FtsI family protein [Actinomadura alba]|uniref:peptidoglycan D,D-transpeptidase FtsI family protein n=2 Tax=Actinomadura alba TaxID=406431 RepID=UPI0028AA797F|nr:penicillin-binding protein 2 [Actinomadura alba]
MTTRRGRGPAPPPPGRKGNSRGRPPGGQGPARATGGAGRSGGGVRGGTPRRTPRADGTKPQRPAATPRRGGKGTGARRPAKASAPPRPRSRVPMRRRDPIKRLNVGLLLIAFVLSLFAGRLVQLQGIESQQYAQQAIRQRLVKIDLPATRGEITDAQGTKLAMTVEAQAIFADPVMVRPGERQRIVEALAPMLGLDPAKVLKAISTPDSRFEYIVHGVKPDQARMVRALGFEGIGTLPEYRRVYPAESLAANVIGFVNRDGEGGGGLEHGMDRVLAGRDGWQRVEISRDGQHIPMGEDQSSKPVPGQGLRLALLSDLQYKAQQAITNQVRATKALSGSVIVMDPRTGHILAMAMAPGFDPNDYGRSSPAARSNPAVEEAFEPGSTNKVITAAAVMEKAGVTAETPFTVPDHIYRQGRKFQDSHTHRTERLTFGGILAQSSNVGTILASEKINPETLYQFMRAFGFGEPTGVKLPGETMGILHPPAKWSATDRYPIAFGQTVSVNALQMASVYATIANGGVRVAPTLVTGTTDEKGRLTPAPEPAKRRVISTQTAKEITRMLEGVTTTEGTAPAAQIPGYRVAGKTGTAERPNPRCHCYRGGGYTASFAGFAPADDPQLVVQVVLQAPKGRYYGGEVAAPVFKDVMSFALQTRKVPPTGSGSPKIQIYARG